MLGLPLCERRAEAFNVLVFMEISYSWACRYTSMPSYKLKAFTENKYVYGSILITAALQMLMTYTPGLNTFFSMCGLGGLAWARIFTAMAVIYIIVEIEKALLDPVLVPMLRPLVDFVRRHAPKFLQQETLEADRDEHRKRDHPSHSHVYTRHSSSLMHRRSMEMSLTAASGHQQHHGVRAAANKVVGVAEQATPHKK